MKERSRKKLSGNNDAITVLKVLPKKIVLTQNHPHPLLPSAATIGRRRRRAIDIAKEEGKKREAIVLERIRASEEKKNDMIILRRRLHRHRLPSHHLRHLLPRLTP